MTSMVDCPDCGARLMEWGVTGPVHSFVVRWKYCPICDWNERRQLMEKMDDESKNSPGP